MSIRYIFSNFVKFLSRKMRSFESIIWINTSTEKKRHMDRMNILYKKKKTNENFKVKSL